VLGIFAILLIVRAIRHRVLWTISIEPIYIFLEYSHTKKATLSVAFLVGK